MSHEARWIKRLSEAARQGRLIDLTDEAGSPDAHLSRHASKRTRSSRWIPAVAIRGVLTSLASEEKGLDPRGLSIKGARIVGEVDWSHTNFPRPLSFSNCVFTRTVDFREAKLRQLMLIDCVLPRLDFGGARIDGRFSAERLIVEGGVSASSAQIDGQLVLDNAHLTNKSGEALNLDLARITGGLRATGLVAEGQVRAGGAQIDGQLVLDNAHLTNKSGEALNLSLARITRDLYAQALVAEGQFNASRAQIDGLFSLDGARIDNPSRPALVLDHSRLGEVYLRPGRILGLLSLSCTSIAALWVSDDTLPPRAPGSDALRSRRGRSVPAGLDRCAIDALGWKLGDLHGSMRRDPRVTATLLDRTPNPNAAAEPRYAVATVYDRIGRTDHARQTRLIAERRITTHTHGVTRIVRRIYGGVAGYGYRPFLPAVWLIATLVIAGILVLGGRGQFVPLDRNSAITAFRLDDHAAPTAASVCTAETGYPCFSTIGFTLQNVVPAASGPLRPYWVVSNTGTGAVMLGVALAALRLLAWVFAALTLAAATGLLRRH